MSERIYARDQPGRLEPLEGERFEKEDELQALIAGHPKLLDGTQMRPEALLRWTLIAREQRIAESTDAAAPMGGRRVCSLIRTRRSKLDRESFLNAFTNPEHHRVAARLLATRTRPGQSAYDDAGAPHRPTGQQPRGDRLGDPIAVS